MDGAAREEAALALRDRFGPFPPELENFLAVLDFKQFLGTLQVQRADITADHVKLVWADGQTAVSPERLVQLGTSTPGARLLPPAGLFYPLPRTGSVGDGLRAVREVLETARLAAPRKD